jgi:protein ImuA
MPQSLCKSHLSSRTKLDLRSIGAQNILSDVFPETAADAGAVGFVLSNIARDAGPILWVQDRVSLKEAGQPFVPGMGTKRSIIRVNVTRPADVLMAMEDGLRTKGLAAVIGEIWGDPAALSFTATKRLAMRAEANALPCWLIRRAASPNLSAARNRWRVASLPSTPHPDDPKAPGDPRWHIELFRARQTKPGAWVASYDPETDRINFFAAFRDGAMDQGDGAIGQRAAR